MSVVSVSSEGGLAWVTVDNPPVNATSTSVRQGLRDAVAAVAGHDLAVLRCAGRTFVAGGDMREFDRAPEEPHLPDVVDAIESSPVPFLALLHGTVLGGGLEIAMACAFRIASPGTRFGLPEAQVGLIPGAGGTQRGPRLFGWQATVDMACLGQLQGTDTALALGAIDAVAEDLEASARRHAAPRPEPVSRRAPPPVEPGWWQEAEAKVRARAKGQTAPLDALRAIRWASAPFAEGQPKERRLHLELRQSEQGVALRHMFFAERAVARPAAIVRATPRPSDKVAIVGGGLMGSGIAAACLAADCKVAVIERDAEAAGEARARIEALVDGAMKRGKIDRAGRDARLAALSVEGSACEAAGAEITIEAVFEDIEAKRAVFARLGAVMAPEAILATNTSYLDPRDIFEGVANRSRCLGLHFFSPAHIMRLVEVVALPETTPETVATGFALARRLGKVAVHAGICDGFIGNRLLAVYRRAAEYMLADGALPEQIDAAMRNWGMAMGPFEAQDMVGLQIAQAYRRRADATRDPEERYVEISDRLCSMGRLGRRAGRGWYRHAPSSPRPEVDPEVTALIEDYSREKGLTRRHHPEPAIRSRLLAALANEGARVVEEGIAENDAAVDVVKVRGYGFPRWRGGPMHWARCQVDDTVPAALAELESASPGSWVRAQRYRS